MLTAQQIKEKAKNIPDPTTQKRLVNKLFRAQSTKKGLPSHNNDFNVADRAIKRLSRYYSYYDIEFNLNSYVSDIELEIRTVISDAWN